MDFKGQCRAGESIDAMLASGRSAEAEKSYHELLERVLETKMLDILRDLQDFVGGCFWR